jgi:dephospho-CoA kinase
VTAQALRIGLTGPIGCGKSTIASWLAARGAASVDADRIAFEVTQPGEPALDAVLRRFGDRVRRSDGSLDRGALAAIVFADPAALKDLEAIVHPAVRPRILAAVESAEARGAPAVAIEAIRLVESGLADVCDEVWLVTCEPAEQRRRLAERGVPDADAERRIVAQADITERLRPGATREIDSNGPRDRVERCVDEAWRAALAKRDAS